MVDPAVELHGVPVWVRGAEQSHEVIDVAHGHGQRAGGEVADALRVQDVEQSAELARRGNPVRFIVYS